MKDTAVQNGQNAGLASNYPRTNQTSLAERVPPKGVPALYRSLFEHVFADNPSRARAIKAKCLDCSCFQREEIVRCTVKSCPLWLVRPYIDRPKQAGKGNANALLKWKNSKKKVQTT